MPGGRRDVEVVKGKKDIEARVSIIRSWTEEEWNGIFRFNAYENIK